MFGSQLDLQWREVGASLRKGTLYVKMPREKVLLLIEALKAVNEDLLQKRISESPKSFVFSGPVDDWKEDLVTLKDKVYRQQSFGLESDFFVIFQELITTIEAGLRNDAQVDWISRVNGPVREDLDALEALEPQSEEPKPSLP